jgi:hypothetical protein
VKPAAVAAVRVDGRKLITKTVKDVPRHFVKDVLGLAARGRSKFLD